jgi:hypothetical protein
VTSKEENRSFHKRAGSKQFADASRSLFGVSAQKFSLRVANLGLLVAIVLTASLFFTSEKQLLLLQLLEPTNALPIAIASVLVTIVTVLFFRYLTPISPSRTERARLEFERLAVDTTLLLRKIKDGARYGVGLSDDDKERLFREFERTLASEGVESFAERLREQVASQVRTETTELRFLQMCSRLTGEVQAQTKRGNVNLLLGMVTSVVGIAVLAGAVFQPVPVQSTQELVGYYAPRLSLALLIEVFAYFFLRLYKQSLTEIKYFQNEITNIESKQIALDLASSTGDPALTATVVDEFVRTERNFVLQKDQTTLELERERIALGSRINITDMLRDLLKKRTE